MGTLTSVLSLSEGEEAISQPAKGFRMSDGAKIKPLSFDEVRGWVRVTSIFRFSMSQW